MTKILLLLTLIASPLAFAESPSALTFQAWKEQQILEAQNLTLRISARIAQLKSSSKPDASGAKEVSLPNSKVRKAETASVAAAERDLRRALDSLQVAHALTLEDYVSVYLPTLEGQTEAVSGLAPKLSKDELAAIFRALVVRGGGDAKRQAVGLNAKNP